MSAQKAPRPERSGEVIYLLIPPGAGEASTPTFFERAHYQLWLLFQSEGWSNVSRTVQALVGAVGFTLLACAVLYVLYYLKSILGIDLFGDKHLEDFVPVPGYHRW